MKILSAVAIATISLSACASTSYIPPTEGPIAKIRFASSGVLSGDKIIGGNSGYADVIEYKSDDCSGEPIKWEYLSNLDIGRRDKSPTIPLHSEYNKDAHKEFLITANKTYNWLIDGGATLYGGFSDKYYSCGVPFSFSFTGGKMYEALYVQPTLSECYIELSEIIIVDSIAEKKLISNINNTLTNKKINCKEVFLQNNKSLIDKISDTIFPF